MNSLASLARIRAMAAHFLATAGEDERRDLVWRLMRDPSAGGIWRFLIAAWRIRPSAVREFHEEFTIREPDGLSYLITRSEVFKPVDMRPGDFPGKG